MLRIFDRYLIRIFVRAFLICFSSLVGLYIVIDAFTNLDEFSERANGLWSVLTLMGQYYSYRVCLFFDRLAGVITTLSAMFTFSWIQRTNELMPLLTAGVPVYRVIAPVLIAAVVICGATVANQEMLIPRIAGQLQRGPNDDGQRTTSAHPTYDRRGILIGGSRCNRQEQKVVPAFVALPPQLTGAAVVLHAAEAQYRDVDGEEPCGGWLLTGVTATDVPCPAGVLEQVGPDSYFLHTSVTFQKISQQREWFEFASTRDLLDQVRDQSNSGRTEMEVLLHARLTRPLATLTLLFLGIPFVLSGTDRRMVSLIGLSLVVSLGFQVFCYLCQRMGNVGAMRPDLAAWLPLMVFGSLGIAMFDLVKT